jgi:hypothetical protein
MPVTEKAAVATFWYDAVTDQLYFFMTYDDDVIHVSEHPKNLTKDEVQALIYKVVEEKIEPLADSPLSINVHCTQYLNKSVDSVVVGLKAQS